MALENRQLGFEDVSEDYKAFVDKFKPKKTTDDCYTPQIVYDAILNWCIKEYGIDPDKVVRPFYPGGDYERFGYPEGCVVLDNPPFSIITPIVRNYCRNGIRFFLFAPSLTLFTIRAPGHQVCHITTKARITYENGAKVATAFVTNLDEENAIVSSSELNYVICEADRKSAHEGKG